MRGRQKALFFFNFCFMGVFFNYWWLRGSGVGAESLIQSQPKSNLLFIASVTIQEHEERILPSSLYSSGVNQGNEEGR